MTEQTAFAEAQDSNSTPSETSVVSTSETPPPQEGGEQSGAADTPESAANGSEQLTEEERNAQAIEERKRQEARELRGTERRMRELTSERYKEKARADYWEEQARLRAEGQPYVARPQQAAPGLPQRDQYGSFEEWQDARTVWLTQRAFQQMLGAVGAQNQEAAQRQQWNDRLDKMQSNLSKSQRDFMKANPDYEDAIANGHDEQLPWPAAMSVMEHPLAGAMMFQMSQDPEFVLRLQRMSPDAQRVAVGELAATIRNKAPSVSKASRPGEPVGSKPGTSSEPPENTSAYFEWAKKNLK